jgi:hypothetical protein
MAPERLAIADRVGTRQSPVEQQRRAEREPGKWQRRLSRLKVGDEG